MPSSLAILLAPFSEARFTTSRLSWSSFDCSENCFAGTSLRLFFCLAGLPFGRELAMLLEGAAGVPTPSFCKACSCQMHPCSILKHHPSMQSFRRWPTDERSNIDTFSHYCKDTLILHPVAVVCSESRMKERPDWPFLGALQKLRVAEGPLEDAASVCLSVAYGKPARETYP